MGRDVLGRVRENSASTLAYRVTLIDEKLAEWAREPIEFRLPQPICALGIGTLG